MVRNFFYGGKDTHITATHRNEVKQAFIAADKDYTKVIFLMLSMDFIVMKGQAIIPKLPKSHGH